jgi:hypothetical protein
MPVLSQITVWHVGSMQVNLMSTYSYLDSFIHPDYLVIRFSMYEWKVHSGEELRVISAEKPLQWKSGHFSLHLLAPRESTFMCLQNSLSSTFLRVCERDSVKERHTPASWTQWLASKCIMLNGLLPKQNATLLQFLHHSKAHILPLTANGKIQTQKTFL